MQTLEHFKEFCDEMTSSASRKHKQEVLTKYKDDEIIQRYLRINFDPYTVYGISTKKLAKRVRPAEWYQAATVFDLFDYLAIHNTGRDEDIAACREMLFVAGEVDPVLESLLEELICKDLSIGADAKILNSVIPNLIPQFSCMLAEKYFDKPQRVEGKEFAITTKLDGFRLIIFKEADGSIKCYSRVGQLVEGLIEIEEEIRNNLPCNLALDGELTISNYFDMPSKDAYKAASKIIRLKGDTPKTGLTYRVFDCMPADEFKAQHCDKTYVERRAMLESFPVMTHVEVLPVLYQGSDKSKIIEWLTKITNEGGEGCMVNLTQAKYQWKRSCDLLKVKKFADMELEVFDFEEGDGKYRGMLGAFICKYKNNIVKVGSGLTDIERITIWQDKESYRGKLITINYFEESFSDGVPSLRFPTFVRFREI